MKKIIALLMLATLCSSCAAWKPSPKESLETAHEGKKSLAQAVEMLGKGDSAGASRILGGIVSDTPLPGVTDEALFRLALLSLKPTPEHPATRRGRLLLKRLRQEYPNSPWTAQAAPLTQLLNTADELKRQSRSAQKTGAETAEDLKRQNKSLKATNDELTRQVKELNQNLEKLKHLDLELEKKNR